MTTKVYPAILRNFIRSMFMAFAAILLIPAIAKADTPIPTGIVTNYNPALQRLTLNVNWYWTSQSNSKYVGAAVFADLNGDGIIPTVNSNPATYNSGGNPFPAGLQARDEFLGQLAISNIEGSATSSMFPAIIDNTDNGVASGVSGVTTTTARMLFPYGTNSISVVNASGNDNGSFTMTFNNLTISPTKICVILYDPHSTFTATGGHSVVSAGPNYNTDNSLEDGNNHGTVSCTGLVSLNCAINKTEAACQTQTAINAAYAAWLATATASGCNGTLTNNSTGAPSATGGSKTVTFTYTQNGCSNQAAVTTCTATFTVATCTLGSIGDRVWYDTDRDGIQDSGEDGIRGVPVKLRNSSNVVVNTVTTDVNGNYLFSGLSVGDYRVEFPTTVYGYLLSPAYVGTNRNIDSDPSVTTGITPVINVTAGSNNTSIDAGYAPDCDCVSSPGNLLTNPSFENGTTGWSWSSSNGSLTTGTGYVACGAKNGFNDHSSGTSRVWQDANVVNGSTVTFKAFAGTHAPGLNCSPKLSLIFLNSSNTVLGQTDVTVTRVVGDYNDQLEQYSITAVAPTGTTKARVQSTITCNTMKLDAFCLTVVPPPAVTNPDFNSTYVNVPVPGNVSTNDVVPAGTTYGTSPTLVSSPAGSTPALTMNSNGTYSFVSNKVGVYTYNVPVCTPGQAAPCPPTALVITVLDNINNNSPVANVDIATTKINTAVTLKTLANDAAGSLLTALVPSSVMVTVPPANGTTSVNPATGDITYTPATGYTGTDTLTYQVCDNQSPAKCATAKQIITIRPSAPDNKTAAADDYKIVEINTSGSGNVKINDTDPEGDAQTVTAQTTTIAGKGTLVLATTGIYTFTPVTGYTGPVDFPYTTCDNGTPVACATATLHILVRPEVPSTNPDFNSTYVNVPVPGNVSTNDKMPVGTTYGGPTLTGSPAGSTSTITMNSNGTYSFVSDKPGVYTYNVPVCLPAQAAPCPPTALVITVLDSYIHTNGPVANVDIATTKMNVPVTLKTLVNDAAGNVLTALVPSSVTVITAPANGTTSINAATGDITYTPNAGYIGTDTLTYRVCDNQTPAKCATAKQIITIRPTVSPNTTAAADDYKIVEINTPGSGNVKTNDTDPEGHAQTVTAQAGTTIAGKGTLVLAADGNYTFTPVANFTGPVDFPYTTCDNGTPQACATATLHILVRPEVPSTNPDFNSTYVNVPVPGNVSTNDKMPAGTTYGTPVLAGSPAGSTPVITLNPDGTYSFVSDKPGVYTYNVPVCLPGQAAPCPTTPLVITVLDRNVNTNPPVANVDIATTKMNVPVTLKTLANDAAGNVLTALVPSSVTVTVAPAHGTTSVNAATGDITYTPATGYIGTDTLTYQVCDNQTPAKCATAKQIITIRPTVSPNTTAAADDYKIVEINTPGSGNVKTNDTDPEGHAQTVTAQAGTTIAGKGTLVLAADGNYTFTPVANFTGPVDFPYTTCDNGTPQACATATLHILVRPEVPSTNPDFNSTYVNVPVPGNVSTNDKMPAGTTYGTPVLAGSPAGSTPVITLNPDGTYSFVSDKPGVYTYNVPVCLPGQAAPCPTTPLVITVLDRNVNTNPPVANVDIATTKMNVPVTLKTLANDAAGNVLTALVPSSVTVTVAPAHGTTSINAATGDITYTPNAGYIGTDTLTYRVCDNQTPAKCATAKQIITIRPTVSPNTTSAADDYKIVEINTPGTGNVKTNDTDPEGHTQTVTAQPGTTIAGKGTLVLAADGSYTFTPVADFTGPVDFPYTTCDNGTPQACATATLHILVRPEVPSTNPDFNSTYVNVPVPGNVSTNDKMPLGTTYGTSPTLVSGPAGSTPVLTMLSNGNYGFISDKPGVYTYNVPVCLPGQAAPCPPTPLVITVLDATIFTNGPVANVDIATTKVNVPVTLKTLANDAAGNITTSLDPSSVTVTVAPAHGTTNVNPATGDITYTPNAGYIGTDTLTYQVCDNQTPAKCATAKQIITIRPTVSPNTTAAADDYKITNVNTPATGNVKTNDTDPEGNTQTVIVQPGTTVPGKGTLVLAADGSYTFTPVGGYTGPVDFPYTTCDNGVPVACATATLHILVRPLNPITNPDFNSTFVNVPVPGNVNTNDKVPTGTTYGTSPTLVSGPAGSTPVLTMNPDGTYIFVSNLPGVYTYDVPVCVPGQIAPCPPTRLVITVLDINISSNPPVANVDIATTNINTPVTLKTLVNDAAGNVTSSLVPSSVTVTVPPMHGTTSVNTTTGDITYTPNAGYTGTDTLTYQVCDNQAPAKCATAKQIITIRPLNAPNTTTAADDYKITQVNTPATGNVKANDSDPEGHIQTVTVQTTNVPGKGTLVLAADGSYTFTPQTGFAGPVDFPYTTCDNGTPQACASATLHILVRPAVPVPDLSPNITAVPNIMVGTTVFNATVRVTELLGVPTNGSEIIVRIPKDPRVTFTYNNAATQIGFTPVNNSVWTYDGSDDFFHIFRTTSIIAANSQSTFGFVATFVPGQSRGKYTLTSSLGSGSGGEVITNNNQDAEVLDYFIN